MDHLEKNRSCCFTGHRPEKLTAEEAEIKTALFREIKLAVNSGVKNFYTGMARGVDLWAAEIVLAFKKDFPELRLICAIPYQGFEKRWALQWQKLYRCVLSQADEIHYFYPSFHYRSFQERNCWMADHSNTVIAVYNGEKGGTQNTLSYAEKRGLNIRMIRG